MTATQNIAQMKLTEMPIITMRYDELVGQDFTGYLDGAEIIPADADLVIRSKLDAIQNVAQGKVWKGFTNYQDSKCGHMWDYRLYVELNCAGIQNPTKFRITSYKTVDMKSGEYEFNVGFSLKVTAIY